jgi:hypothetical protein
MVRTVWPMASLLALSLLPSPSADGRTARRPAAVVATIAPVYGQAGVWEATVAGALIAGKRWVSSEKAVGSLRKGDRLSLYALQEGVIGSALLTDGGTVLSEDEEESSYASGLVFRARLRPSAGKAAAYARAKAQRFSEPFLYVDMLAARAADGSDPKWLTGKVLSGAARKGSTHWRLVAAWLRGRGVSEKAIAGMVVEHAVQADIDRDGQDEVFLSVHCREVWAYTESGKSGPTWFSYLLMRRLRPGRGQADTVVLDDQAWRSLWVVGFCDLDRDGRAEVITQGAGLDYVGAHVFRWNGKRFRNVAGWAIGR